MLHRILAILFLLAPLTAGAVYFPGGIDWTNPSQSRFVQSLYLNMLGRSPDTSETETTVRVLRRNDNRTARLRVFESLLQSAEYQRIFNETDSSWQVFQAPDYNFNNGRDYYRYRAARSKPQGFTSLPRGGRGFSESVARSIAHYYNGFCYRGDPCIDNPELARDKHADPPAPTSAITAHACADQSGLTTQFKWVAINGTTYPRGIDRQTICLEDAYFKTSQLSLERYDCDAGFTDCQRNRSLDLRASRSGTDNDGHPALFFRDGSRLSIIKTDQSTDNSVIIQSQQNDPLLADGAHACADPSQTNSRFTWQTPTRTADSKGIGTTVICMDNYYYAVQRMVLRRHNCDRGFTNCRPDPSNNLTATHSTRVNGNPALEFPNGTTVTLTARNVESTNPSSRTNERTNTNNQTRQRAETQQRRETQPQTRTNTTNTTGQRHAYGGSECADSRRRLSQFRWKSQGLSSWPDGIDGTIICLNDSYYEITASSLRNYSCQSNYSNCTANPSKNVAVRAVSQDGTIWTLANGDEVSLITR